jgi:hypothetical protein
MNIRAHKIAAAWRALDASDARRDQDAAWKHLCDLRTRERDRFAASRGWVACPQFTTARLIGLRGRRVRDVPGTDNAIDHRSCFAVRVDGSPKLREVAIVSHIYGKPERCVEFADKYGLAVEILEFSWYLPQLCTAVLLQRPD